MVIIWVQETRSHFKIICFPNEQLLEKTIRKKQKVKLEMQSRSIH